MSARHATVHKTELHARRLARARAALRALDAILRRQPLARWQHTMCTSASAERPTRKPTSYLRRIGVGAPLYLYGHYKSSLSSLTSRPLASTAELPAAPHIICCSSRRRHPTADSAATCSTVQVQSIHSAVYLYTIRLFGGGAARMEVGTWIVGWSSPGPYQQWLRLRVTVRTSTRSRHLIYISLASACAWRRRAVASRSGTKAPR